MALKIIIRNKAKNDILEAASYSSTFGSEKLKNYMSKINNSIMILSKRPKIGAPLIKINKNLRSTMAGKHRVYYTVEQNTLVILRVMPPRKNPDKYRLEIAKDLLKGKEKEIEFER